MVTTILDPAEAPATELARLYHERWEIEGTFDEIKTHLKGSHLPLRSKSPDLVIQEFWGLMLCHWAIRDLMHQASKHRSRDPDEISFVAALRLVKCTLPGRAALSLSASKSGNDNSWMNYAKSRTPTVEVGPTKEHLKEKDPRLPNRQ